VVVGDDFTCAVDSADASISAKPMMEERTGEDGHDSGLPIIG